MNPKLNPPLENMKTETTTQTINYEPTTSKLSETKHDVEDMHEDQVCMKSSSPVSSPSKSRQMLRREPPTPTRDIAREQKRNLRNVLISHKLQQT